DEGSLADREQGAGLADADALGEVGQDGDGLFVRQAGGEQGRALALGEAGLAGAAVEQAALVLAVAHADGQVAMVALAVVGALGVLAAEGGQGAHGRVVSRGGVRGCRTASLVVEKPRASFNTRRTPPNS